MDEPQRVGRLTFDLLPPARDTGPDLRTVAPSGPAELRQDSTMPGVSAS